MDCYEILYSVQIKNFLNASLILIENSFVMFDIYVCDFFVSEFKRRVIRLQFNTCAGAGYVSYFNKGNFD